MLNNYKGIITIITSSFIFTYISFEVNCRIINFMKKFKKEVISMSWEQEWIEDLKYLEENHQKEIDDYEKYFNKETFDKIVNKLKENKNYLIKFDDFYDEDKKFLGTINIINKDNDIKVFFKLLDFGSPDCRGDMEEYLKGNLYSLDIKLSFDILPYSEIKVSYEFIEEVKKQIDLVLKEI